MSALFKNLIRIIIRGIDPGGGGGASLKLKLIKNTFDQLSSSYVNSFVLPPWAIIGETVVVAVNQCITSLFGTNGLLSDIVIRYKRCSQLMR